jgi:hypothetical protein
MDIKMMTMALLQFGLALFSGILIMYVAFSLIRRFLLQRFPNAYTNPAFGILCAAILFSVGYLMSGIVAPAVSFFRIQSGQLTSTDYLLFSVFSVSAAFCRHWIGRFSAGKFCFPSTLQFFNPGCG